MLWSETSISILIKEFRKKKAYCEGNCCTAEESKRRCLCVRRMITYDTDTESFYLRLN